MDQKVLLLCDTMLQYTMNMLRAFNVDDKLSDSQWKSGVKAMQSWNNEIIKEECVAIRKLDAGVDKMIQYAISNYKFGSKKVKIEDMLPNFLNTLSKSHAVCDRSVFDLNFADLGSLFRRVTRRSLYLTSQSLSPNDSISQVMFRDRSGALKSWRSAAGGSKASKTRKTTKPPPSLLSTIEEPPPPENTLEPPPPENTLTQVKKKKKKTAEATVEEEEDNGIEYSEVTRCFQKLV